MFVGCFSKVVWKSKLVEGILCQCIAINAKSVEIFFDFLHVDKDEKAKCSKCNSEDLERQMATYSVGSSSKKENGGCSSCPGGSCPYSS